MLVQYYFPKSLSHARLDRYLAGGWFRGANMLYRSQLICFKEDLYSVVNIRLKLEGYTFSKSLRKILKQNGSRFQVRIGFAQIDEARERLYARHKERFKGFVFDTLYQFLYSDSWYSVFDTREIAVYDGDTLVAVSYFDVGKTSIASLLGLYDGAYAKYSLGTYTMLVEVEEAMRLGMKNYYPGYVLDGFDGFDYKLRLGTMQCYDWQGKWRSMEKLSEIHFSGNYIKQRVKEMRAVLKEQGIAYKCHVNPFFSISYLDHMMNQFIQSCVYIACPKVNEHGASLIIEYIYEKNTFQVSWVAAHYKYEEFFEAEIPNDLLEDQGSLYCYEEIVFASDDPLLIARQVNSLLQKSN